MGAPSPRRLYAALIVALLLLLSILPTPRAAGAAESGETDWELLQEERKTLETSATAARAAEIKAAAELFALNRTLEEIRVSIVNLGTLVTTVREQQAEARLELSRLETKRLEVRAQFGQRARYYSENGSFSLIGFLIQADTLSDFLGRIDLLNLVLRRDARLMNELKSIKAQVQAQESVLSARQKELTDLRTRQQEQEVRLTAEAGRKEEFLAQLKEDRAAVEARVGGLEQVWSTAARPVLEAFGSSLQTLALRVGDIQTDSIQFSLFPPGATVRVTEQNLNDFIATDNRLKGLQFKLLPGEVNLEGSFSEVLVTIRGRFLVVDKAIVRYEPIEIRFMDVSLPAELTRSLLASGRLDMDLSSLIGVWALKEIKVDKGSMTATAGMK